LKWRRINRLITIQLAAKVTSWTYASQVVFIDSINSANFAINGETFAAHKLLCRAITARQQTWIDSGGTATDYYDIVYQFEASSDANGHKLVRYNMGFEQLVGGELVTITSKSGKKLTRPSYLKTDGTVATTDGDKVLLTFYPHRVVDWGTSPF
jgi:hypothetical protein